MRSFTGTTHLKATRVRVVGPTEGSLELKKIPNEKGGRDKLNWHTILYVVLLLISYLCTNYDVDKEGFRSARMD